jgi:hypothetical protein
LSLGAAALLAASSAVCQTAVAAKATSTPKQWTAPRTPDGHPDLQGIWTNTTITPLERPADLAGKPFLTEQEAAAYEKKTVATQTGDRRDGGAEVDVGRSYNEFWRDRGTKIIGSRRTSLITDPPDGKIPSLTPAAVKKQEEASIQQRLHGTDGPENRNLWERCITRGLPMLPGPYNNDFEIVQTPGYVVILHEMIHDARIIPLDGRPHPPTNVRQWMGDGRGHWEGDTLVVDTTNFTDKTRFNNSSENLHVVERFTPVDGKTLLYRFTIEDPQTWDRPWTGEYTWPATDKPIYEYACHEGNYAMGDILRGARREEAGK